MLLSKEQKPLARTVAQQLAQEFSKHWQDLNVDFVQSVDEILQASPSTNEDIGTIIDAAALVVSILSLAFTCRTTFKNDNNGCEPTTEELTIIIKPKTDFLPKSSEVDPELLKRIIELTVEQIIPKTH
jgi:hypothetical protein